MGRLALADEALMDADSAKLNDDMHLGRGDSTMIDRRRTTAVLAAVGVLGVAACGADPKVLTSYTPAAGVNGKSATVKVQNLVLINGGGQARVSAAVVSRKDDNIVGITGGAAHVEQLSIRAVLHHEDAERQASGPNVGEPHSVQTSGPR